MNKETTLELCKATIIPLVFACKVRVPFFVLTVSKESNEKQNRVKTLDHCKLHIRQNAGLNKDTRSNATPCSCHVMSLHQTLS